MTLTSNPSHAFFWILFNVMLPESQDGPALTSKLSGYHCISSHVSLNLIPPELLCKPLLLMILVAVPKIPVTEYHSLFSWKNKIRISEHLGIHLILVSGIAKHLVHPKINLGIGSPDPRHDPRTLFRGEYVGHSLPNLFRNMILHVSFVLSNYPLWMNLPKDPIIRQEEDRIG